MKKVILLLLSIIVISPIQITSQESKLRDHNRQLIERWLELWNTQNLQIADNLYNDHVLINIPHFNEITNLESYKKEITNTRNEIEEFHAELNDILFEDNKIAARFTAGGLIDNHSNNNNNEKVKYNNTWIVMFELKNGKIAEEWWQFDLLGVMQQQGIISSTEKGLPALRRAMPAEFNWGEESILHGEPGEAEANKELVLEEYFAWTERDSSKVIETLNKNYDPDFIYHDPARPHVTNLESYKKWAVNECLKPFPDLEMPVDEIIADNDKVAVRWTFTGTHKMFGKPITQSGISIYRIADGKIIEGWCACDMLGTVQQINEMTKKISD